MGKEFVEYSREDGRIPYNAGQLCFCLTQYAKNYINDNREITKEVDTKVRDAVLVDAINYLGVQGGCDFALYTRDLHDDKKHEEEVDGQCLLTVLQNHYAGYIFNNGISNSVLRNNHMNECKEPFAENDGAIVLIDFINYIAEQNDYDRRFTAQDLYQIAQKQNHNSDMRQLKLFLECTNQYTERLQNGENIDDMFQELAEEKNLKYISTRGKYHYTDEVRKRVGQSQMFSWTKEEVDRELYAMTYAYAKLGNEVKPETQIISKKIREMKKR